MSELRTLTKEERAEIEVALEILQSTQTAFWNAMGEMEGLFDNRIELDGNRDYEDYTVEDLLEMEREGEEEN